MNRGTVGSKPLKLTKRPGSSPPIPHSLPSMAIHDVTSAGLGGDPVNLDELKGKAVLVVNVASKCGLTPQYAGLERLQGRYAGRGFTVLGVPCNQFGGQEPGSPDEIAEF